MRTFLPAMWPAFFIRVRPASRNANPACMNMTSTAVMTTQIVLAATRRSLLDTRLHLLEPASRAVVHHVVDSTAPHDPVTGFVSAPRRVGDHRSDVVGDLVLDEEDQERLRQEARLEHATAVLVRDAALAAVPDRLDHGHADVPGRLLDCIDHGLDPLPDHHRLHLHHLRLLPARVHEKSPARTKCVRGLTASASRLRRRSTCGRYYTTRRRPTCSCRPCRPSGRAPRARAHCPATSQPRSPARGARTRAAT